MAVVRRQASRGAGALALFVLALFLPSLHAFVPQNRSSRRMARRPLFAAEDDLEKTFGGYTVKQRLREEVESPFRTVRLFFFGSSTGSALVALYFSTLSAGKAASGLYPDVDLNDALQSCAINVAAAALCGFLTYRDWQAGNANLARIKQGGALAKLQVTTASTTTTLADYRRKARVVLAVGGLEYLKTLAHSVNSDVAKSLQASDIMLVPVLLQAGYVVGDARKVWMEEESSDDVPNVVAFPRGPSQWQTSLASEIQTCETQGYDVLSTGFTVTVKKNGRILRRATGQPPFGALVETMEVLDGSKFGMPGDDEKYGGA